MNTSTTLAAPSVSSAQHTSGDWVVFDGHVYHADHKIRPFTRTDGSPCENYHTGLIALVYGTHHEGIPAGDSLANACILAAAPKMLTALKKLVANQEEGWRSTGTMPEEHIQNMPYLREARAAISAAEGRA